MVRWGPRDGWGTGQGWGHWGGLSDKGLGYRLGMGFQTRDRIPDMWMEFQTWGWGSRHGDRVPDKRWGPRHGDGVPDMGIGF